MQKKTYSVEWAGKTLSAEFSNLADQANGSVLVRYGNTAVFATAVMSEKNKEGDYFPLSVDYEEKFYASGQILGSQFVRREGRPSEDAILSGRIVDRTIRPLFPQYIRREVQVVVTALAVDTEDPDVLAVVAASLALGTSNIPWRGPVGAVRIARKRGENNFIVNPNYLERPEGGLDLEMFICGKDRTINMIETAGFEIGEDVLLEAFKTAEEHIDIIQKFQEQIIAEIGKTKTEIPKPELSPEAKALFESVVSLHLHDAVFSGAGKVGIHTLQDKWVEKFIETFPEERPAIAEHYFEDAVDLLIHEEALQNNRRADGREMNQLRDLYAQAGGVSEVLHGSGIFYRGGTHVFSALTLGGPEDSLVINSEEGVEKKRHFMHHYNFPPFSVGEVGKMGGTNRRMVGHGALAEKALFAVVPPKDVFPYTIRIVSESMASNGSTSMGSVCASTLALMDAGVPIKAPVAGIAMGLMIKESGEYVVLTDIQGPEDHYGDMDFKVAGTENGVTAIQLDVKVDGVKKEILAEALLHAKNARLNILKVITEAIAAPRTDISPRAPKIVSLKIKPDQIGLVIGGGGKTINAIRESTGAEINIEDDGTVYVTGKNGSAEKAANIIRDMTREYKVGEKFDGVVTKILDFGAFVKIGHSAEGMVHISEIAPFRIEKVTEALKEGETVPVVIKEIDDRGRINLSIRLANPQFAEQKGLKAPAPRTPPQTPNTDTANA